MINFQETKIKKIIIHKVGNKHRDEDLILSDSVIQIDKESTIENMLLNHLLRPFKKLDLFEFNHEVDLLFNENYKQCKWTFSDETFLTSSQMLANNMFDENSAKCKECDFIFVLFEDVIVNDETLNAIGIYRSENSQYFVQSLFEEIEFKIGNAIGKLDFGAIVFETNEDRGYLVNLINTKDSFFKSWLNLRVHINDYERTHILIENLEWFFKYSLVDLSAIEIIKKQKLSLNWLQSEYRFTLVEFFSDIFNGEYLDKFQEKFSIEDFTIDQNAVDKFGKKLLKTIKLDESLIIDSRKSNINLIQESDERGKFYKIYYKNQELK